MKYDAWVRLSKVRRDRQMNLRRVDVTKLVDGKGCLMGNDRALATPERPANEVFP
jgi:hypothetical protein